MGYAKFYQNSIDHPEAFWAEQAQRIDWKTPFHNVVDYSQPPFSKWFVGGTTNLCHNAIDRWVERQGDQTALITISTETADGAPTEQQWTFKELQREVERTAAIFQSLGIGMGDTVLIYMPMIAEATFAMLACARLGVIHSVVFGGFAAHSLATRIDDAKPCLIVSADAGSRMGKVIPYKPLLDEAIRLSSHQPQHVLLVDRHLAPMERIEGRDIDYAEQRSLFLDAKVPVTWLQSDAISYILYTSGTTGKPKGVQRDVGGYAVALATAMEYIYCAKPRETYFCTSDIGWVVGHSFIVYGPLIAGMATIMYEGVPVRPDASIWWQIVEKYKVTRMFSAPTAVRVLKKHPVELMRKHDLSSLKALYLAGEPLDEPTSAWIEGELGVPIIDNYWQTETGWPILSIAKGVEDQKTRLGSPGIPMPGYKVKLLNEITGEVCADNEKGVVVIEGPLPPGCMQTVFGDDQRFINTYWSNFSNQRVYSTFDWGIRDADGYYFILGRTDDVINVAGHRLGTREIEEVISGHPNVSEVAVVGVEDSLKGQVAWAFVVPKNSDRFVEHHAQSQFQTEIVQLVDQQLGALARPAQVYCVNLLPKTRSGKLLRRLIKSVCEGKESGDTTTMEDPSSLEQIRNALKSMHSNQR